MPVYGFKPNPKALVSNKAKALFGRETKVVVTGARPTPLDAKQLGIPTGTYFVECHVDGKFIGSAHHRDWRKAYNLLVIEVEKAHEKTLAVLSDGVKI